MSRFKRRNSDGPGDEFIDDESLDEAALDAALQESEAGLDGLRTGLRTLLEPRSGVEDRILKRVRTTLLDREVMMTLASLFGLGWRTPKVVFLDSESTPDDGQEKSGQHGDNGDPVTETGKNNEGNS